MDYDTVLLDVGEWGMWQRRLFFILWLPSCLSSVAVFMYEFIAFTPEFSCVIPDCESPITNRSLPDNVECKYFSKWDNACQEQVSVDMVSTSCSSWEFSQSIMEHSAVQEFSMVCDQEWMKNFAQSMYMVGMLIGSFCFGWFGDKHGRKPCLMLAIMCLTIGGTLPKLSLSVLYASQRTYSLFVISRVISGLGHVGTFMVTVTLALEYVGVSCRSMCGIYIEIPFALGGILVAFVNYLGIKEWDNLMLVVSLPNLLILSYWFIIPESPRWLLANNKVEEFRRVIDSAAAVNKRQIDVEVLTTIFQSKDELKSKETGSFTDLLHPGPILIRTLCLFLTWMSTILCYFSLTSYTSMMKTDSFYLTYCLVILAEVPACIFSVIILDRVGRRPVYGGCHLMTGVAAILAAFIPEYFPQMIKVGLCIVGKFCSSACMAIMFVYTAELFPTSIRNRSIGACSFWGRVGGIIAPQILLLEKVWTPLPLLILSLFSLAAGVSVLVLLPETKGTKLPENMEEALLIGEERPAVSSIYHPRA